ncbi:uncharacterized protein [Panulirus ornatus]|uniref:uncharacterized protein n=1 Tax=Panulirus ornatus TaxID=150431 RepID=UPI003A8362EE
MTILCSVEGGNSEAMIRCPVMAQTLLTSGDPTGAAVRSRLTHSDLPVSDECPNGGRSIRICSEVSQSGTGNHKSKQQAVARKCKSGSETQASPRMKELLEGLNEPGDSGNPPEAPLWLDRELFNRGRQFYQRYLFCVFFSDLLALLMMFSVSRILRPLIYTGRSDTPLRALRRYVSTIMHVITWYSGDVWDPSDRAHRDILTVRSIHNNSARTFNSSAHHEELGTLDVRDKGHEEPRCPFNPTIRQDLASQVRPNIVLESPENPPVYISQWDMLLTQFSFVGLIVAHPSRMGAWWVSEKELAGLVHFWRGIGFLLGIEDKYNFCNGTVEETRALCMEMEHLVIKPRIAEVDWSYEHMSSSLMEGISHMIPAVSYPAMFRFLADTLAISLPNFVSRMSLLHTFQYWLIRFIFHVVFLVPGFVLLFNELLKTALNIVQDQNPRWFPKSRTQVTVTPYIYT